MQIALHGDDAQSRHLNPVFDLSLENKVKLRTRNRRVEKIGVQRCTHGAI
jgi:hypothetical protein